MAALEPRLSAAFYRDLLADLPDLPDLSNGPNGWEFSEAELWAAARAASLQKVLIEDCAVPGDVLRDRLAAHFGAPAIAFDERLSIPGELLDRYHAACPIRCLWFPAGERGGGSVAVAAADPGDLATRAQAQSAFGNRCLFSLALEQDVHWLTRDFGTRDDGRIVAAQRTIGACYRTIAARARTGLSFLRTGVTLTGLGLGLVEYFGVSVWTGLDVLLVLAGVLMICDGAMWYLPVRGEYIQTPRCEPDIEP
ncbi:MAG: hypothetical protein HQK81_03525 [Desulfovibrionaceae bacterium]|nr:hypothetical protein [Desulfovibrionaceae bacterium]MBF0513113.1 hypothetical protein [Desulfovibrionaceae bacterium]